MFLIDFLFEVVEDKESAVVHFGVLNGGISMKHESSISYTTEEVAQLLKVSKLTVYDLIKKGEIRAYRVGRQMRVDAVDLEAYKEMTKSGGLFDVPLSPVRSFQTSTEARATETIISGQDLSLDLLANEIEKSTIGVRPLRSYVGSLNSLFAMYQGKADIVSMHLYDGDTGEYNIPYIKKILVGQPLVVYNLLARSAGFFVQKGNPKNIQTWADITKNGVRFMNRERGSGVRTFIDEKLRIEGVRPEQIAGYENEEMNHFAVATKVASGEADVGVGTEKAANLVGIDYIPLIQERYDLVILKQPNNEELRHTVRTILQSESFQKELQAIGGYDLQLTGQIVYEY